MANRYWVGGTGTWNASNTTNWSDSSGGAGGFSVPTSSDDVFFDGNSGGGTVTVTASALGLSINFTGFAGTFAGSSGITISGNVTLGAGTTYTYTGTLTINATATLTANGKTWTGSLTTNTGANTTFTLADAWIIDGSFTFGNSAVTHTFNGFTLSIKTNLTISGSSIASGSDGTTEFIMIGTGNIVHSGSSFSRKLQNPFRINTAGTITFDTHTITFAGDFVYVAGTVVTTGSLVHFNNGSGSAKTLTTNGITFNNVTFGNTSTSTYTLSNVMDITGTLVFGTSNSNTYTLNGSSISAKGDVTITITNGTIAGTTVLNINGTGSQTWSGTSSTPIRLDTNINKSSGTLTLGTNIAYNTGTLTYSSGTVDTTSNSSTLTVAANTTFNTNGINWFNVIFITTGGIYTFTNDFTVNGTFTQGSGSNITFNGSNIYFNGDVVLYSSILIYITGTTNIIFSGTGTWSGGQAFDNDVTITGTYTLGTNVGITGSCVFTCTTGTLITTGNTFNLTLRLTLNVTINTNQALNILSIATGTVTLSQNLILNGSLIYANNTPITINGFTLFIGGGLTLLIGTLGVGTTNFIMNGTGTWSGSVLRNNLTINTAGTITVSGTIGYNTGTLTYTAGTVITTGSTLTVAANTTLNTNGMSFGNISLTAALTLTINSLLSANGTLTLPNANITFAGTSGWSVHTLSQTTSLSTATTYTLVAGKTYTITGQFTVTGSSNAIRALFVSSVGGTRAILTLAFGAAQNVGYTNATDIDSSLGQTVYSFNGSLSNTLNWNTLLYPRQSTFSFEML